MATCRYRSRFLGHLGPVFWFGTRLYEFAVAKERNTEANPSNVVSRRSGQHGSIPSETDLVESSSRFVTNRRLAMRGIETGFHLFGALWILLSESQSGTSKDSDRLCFRPGHEPVLRVWERRCGACLRAMIGAKSQLKRFWRSVVPAVVLFVTLKVESASARFVTDPQTTPPCTSARDRPRVAIRGGTADRQLPQFPAAQLSEWGVNVPAARAGGMQDLAPVRRLHARQDRREPSTARITVYGPPHGGQESSVGPAPCMRRPAVREQHDPAPPT